MIMDVVIVCYSARPGRPPKRSSISAAAESLMKKNRTDGMKYTAYPYGAELGGQ